MIVTFTDADIADMQRLADDCVAFLNRDPNAKWAFPNRTKDPHTAFFEGLLGEWAVSDALGIERRRHTRGADGGVDLVAPSGHTLAVRYRGHRDDPLMAFDNHPVRAAVLVLVVGYRPPHVVKIAGVVSTSRFYEDAERCNVGFGPSRRLAQELLTRWRDAEPRLRSIPAEPAPGS